MGCRGHGPARRRIPGDSGPLLPRHTPRKGRCPMNWGPAFVLLQAEAEGAPGIFGSPLFPMIMIIGVIYLLIFRPQQKQQKQQKEMRKAVGKGDSIIT
ncbi:MAG: preprotein translocase subunit YajC, partial [Deltaproteobacteria bacterium]